MKHLAEHAEEDFHPRGFGKKPKDDDDDEDKDDYHGSRGGGRSQGKGVGRQIKPALPMQNNRTSSGFNNAPSSSGHYRGRIYTVALSAPIPEILELPSTARKPSLTLERYLNDIESPVLIPLKHQKSYSRSSEMVARKLLNNNPETGLQDIPVANRTTRPLLVRKQSPPLGIPLVVIKNRRRAYTGSLRTAPYNWSYSPVFSQLNLSLYVPISISVDKQEKALQVYIKCKREINLGLKHTPATNDSLNLMNPCPTTARSAVASPPSHWQGLSLDSTSTCHAATKLSSALSFGDLETPSSAKRQTEKLKIFERLPRKRILSPAAKAKAALIRSIGACWVCRLRKVPVSNLE
jgi:hypothetical protein